MHLVRVTGVEPACLAALDPKYSNEINAPFTLDNYKADIEQVVADAINETTNNFIFSIKTVIWIMLLLIVAIIITGLGLLRYNNKCFVLECKISVIKDVLNSKYKKEIFE